MSDTTEPVTCSDFAEIEVLAAQVGDQINQRFAAIEERLTAIEAVLVTPASDASRERMEAFQIRARQAAAERRLRREAQERNGV